MASADSDNNSANFFELPREMRHEIYSNLTKDVILFGGTAKGEEGYMQIAVKHAPIPKLARVSQQFKEEYEMQTLPRRILCFKDGGGAISTGKRVLAASPYNTFNKITSDLLAMCMDDGCTNEERGALEDLSDHLKWLNVIQGMRSISAELTIRLYVHWRDGAQLKWEHVDHGSGIRLQLKDE